MSLSSFTQTSMAIRELSPSDIDAALRNNVGYAESANKREFLAGAVAAISIIARKREELLIDTINRQAIELEQSNKQISDIRAAVSVLQNI